MCSTGGGITQSWAPPPHRRGSAAALPQPQGSGMGQRMGTCPGRGWGHAMVKDATSRAAPACQSHTGACVLVRHPQAPWGWGRRWERCCGSQHRQHGQGSPSHVPAGMATCRGQEKPLSPLLSPVQGGQHRLRCGAGEMAGARLVAAAESRSCTRLMAAHAAQPSGRRGHATPKCRLKTGEKTQPG